MSTQPISIVHDAVSELISINGISSDISKFADDSEISRIIKSESDVKDLQGGPR